jgi:hypothetical protein
MLPQLERQYLQANLAQARSFLFDANQDDDPIGQHQYAQLVTNYEHQLKALSITASHAPAGVALFFGGRPVFGSHGIQASFSGKAIDGFQSLVSQRFAADASGPLASKGRVPFKDTSHLLITDVVRGSFGFVLQAASDSDHAPEFDTNLKAAVDKVASTLTRVAAQDESLFDDAVDEIDDRQKQALTTFFTLLDNEGATMRIVEGERDFELDLASVQRARQRVEQLQIEDKTETLEGHITGWTDNSGRFELRLHGSLELIQGNVTRSELERLSSEGIEPYHKHVSANIKTREITSRNRQPKKSYVLNGLRLTSPPSGWQPQAVQLVAL